MPRNAYQTNHDYWTVLLYNQNNSILLGQAKPGKFGRQRITNSLFDVAENKTIQIQINIFNQSLIVCDTKAPMLPAVLCDIKQSHRCGYDIPTQKSFWLDLKCLQSNARINSNSNPNVEKFIYKDFDHSNLSSQGDEFCILWYTIRKYV